jgi:O-antigen/teichoic acid export membrane protein
VSAPEPIEGLGVGIGAEELPTPPSSAAEETTGASVLNSGLWNVASSILPQLYILVTSVVAARFLGPDDMGRQSFISYVALSATALFGGGLASMLMRFVGEALGSGHAAAVRGLVGWAWRLSLVGAVVGGSVMGLAALLGAEPAAAWALAGVGCGLGILQSIPNGALIGAQRWRQSSIVGLTTGTIAVPATIAVLAAGGGIVGFFAVETTVILANLLWVGYLGRRELAAISPSAERDGALQRRAARYAAWTMLSVLLSTIVFKRSEFFFLNHYSSNAEIAIYSIAFAAVFAVTVLPQSLANVLIPAFATLFGGDAEGRVQTGFDRAQRLLLMLGLPLAAATIALGPHAITLVYGEEYSAAGPVLQIMAVGIPLLALMNLSHSFLLGLGKVKPLLLIDLAAAVTNLGLAFLLVPPYQAIGAALANLAGQCTVAIIVLVYALRFMEGVHLDLRVIGASALAAGGGGGAAALLAAELGGLLGLIAGLIAGVAVFVAVGTAIKLIRADDAHWLTASASGTRFGGAVATACRLFAQTPAGSAP